MKSHPDIHEVRLRPPILDNPSLPFVVAPDGRVKRDAPAEPLRPHPMAEWLYGPRPVPPVLRRPSARSVALLGAVVAVLVGAVTFGL